MSRLKEEEEEEGNDSFFLVVQTSAMVSRIYGKIELDKKFTTEERERDLYEIPNPRGETSGMPSAHSAVFFYILPATLGRKVFILRDT